MVADQLLQVVKLEVATGEIEATMVGLEDPKVELLAAVHHRQVGEGGAGGPDDKGAIVGVDVGLQASTGSNNSGVGARGNMSFLAAIDTSSHLHASRTRAFSVAAPS